MPQPYPNGELVIVIDCSDLDRSAQFWAAVLGYEAALEGHDPVRLTNVFHPSNTTLTVAPTNAAHLSTFGIDWGREGQSGFSAPFSWSG